MANEFDVVVVGSGPGGYVCAIRSAQLGLKTALVERYSTFGGTCLNVGCIPSKALLKSSENYWKVTEHFEHHGIEAKGVNLNLKKMMDRKNEVVKKITGGVDLLMRKNKIQTFVGHGQILDKNTVQVGDNKISTKNIVIATGSKPNALKGVEFDKKRIVSSTEALHFEEVPKNLLVIGAGVIGLEMGSIWARLGSKVTVIEYGNVPIPGSDKQVQKQLQKSLEGIGMEFVYNTGVTEGKVSNNEVHLKAKNKDGELVEFKGDYCLVAIGRRPYTDNLGLDKVSIETDKRGFIPVNEKWQTKHSNIYAVGDVIGGFMLAHKAEDEGVAVAEVIAGKAGHVYYDAIPNVIYTYPEVASVGKTEEQLKEAGIPYNTGKFNMAANGRAVASDEAIGFIKVLAHKETDRVLGVHMVCPQASELIAEAGLAMEFYASAEDIGITSHAHPTLSESMKEAALSALKRSIHGA